MIEEAPSNSNEDNVPIPITETFRKAKSTIISASFVVLIFLFSGNASGNRSSNVKFPFADVNISPLILSISFLYLLIYFYASYRRALFNNKIMSTEYFFEKSGKDLALSFSKLSEKIRESTDNSKFLRIDFSEISNSIEFDVRDLNRSARDYQEFLSDRQSNIRILIDDVSALPENSSKTSIKNLKNAVEDFFTVNENISSEMFSKVCFFPDEIKRKIFSYKEKNTGEDSKFLSEFEEIISASKKINKFHRSIGDNEKLYHRLLDVWLVNFLFGTALLCSFWLFIHSAADYFLKG